MAYNYDRTAAEQTWYDVQQDAETGYVDKAAQALARLLGGSTKLGGFASAEVIFGGKTLQMGFKGGGGGTIYITPPGLRRQIEYSVVNHTPSTFAIYAARHLRLLK